MKNSIRYIAVGCICMGIGVQLGVSADAYKDVVCEDTTDVELSFHLANWSPMHVLERGNMDRAVSDEFETLGCRAYVLGRSMSFAAKQRWVKRHDSAPTVKKITR